MGIVDEVLQGGTGGNIVDEVLSEKQPAKRTTGQKIAGAVAPYARPIFEGAGAMLGGIVAAPASIGPWAPATEAAGVGGGYLAGKYAANALEEYAGTKQAPTAREALTKVATQDVPEAVMTGAAGPLIGKAASGVKNLVSYGKGAILGRGGQATSEAAGRAALGGKAGIHLTPAEITQKPSHAILQSELEKNIGSADIARQKALNEMQEAQAYAAKIEQAYFGGKGDALSAGQTAQASAKGRYGAFQKVAGKLYDSVPISPTEPIETHTLKNVATEYREELGKLQGAPIKRVLTLAQESENVVEGKILDAKGKPMTSTTEPTYTWQQLRDDQSTLRKMSRASTDYNRKRILNNLADAINDDITAFGEKSNNPDIKKTLDMANKFYREGTKTIPGIKDFREQKIANAVMKSNNPEDIAGKYMTSSANQSDLVRLQRVIGPKGYRAIKQAWFTDMIGQGEAASFSPAKYVTKYEKYMRGGNLSTMLTKTEKEGADELYKVSKIMVDAEKLASNPSGTGRMNINDLYRWVRHPVIELFTQVGSKKMAEKYFNDPEFQKLLVFGMKQGPESKLAGVSAKMLTTMLTGGAMGAAQNSQSSTQPEGQNDVIY